ncbi:MAG TPA: hypothetical protein VJ673_01080 [Aromatoleum sp.]|uniref:hypothetical protein n=1 Tax=Aromatoleum sp. TaxID=2307007 RepID=UPI002B48CEF8|nr:hypothetical protein [Aromatoleum sp.]HJV24240.1 hypothetical protein [Aromatoleum sp.]
MRRTKSALVNSSLQFSLLAALALPSLAAHADPLPCQGRLASISGKIMTNSMAGGESLGILQGTVDGWNKLKCGINGKPRFNDDGSFAGFTHSLVCDDTVISENRIDTIHSQVISNSRFDGVPSFRSCGIPGMDLTYGAFREISEPQSGRGIFSPTGGGRLVIDGVVNCAGAVDMKFTGEVCLVR